MVLDIFFSLSQLYVVHIPRKYEFPPKKTSPRPFRGSYGPVLQLLLQPTLSSYSPVCFSYSPLCSSVVGPPKWSWGRFFPFIFSYSLKAGLSLYDRPDRPEHYGPGSYWGSYGSFLCVISIDNRLNLFFRVISDFLTFYLILFNIIYYEIYFYFKRYF